MHDLGALDSEYAITRATGINNDDTVVGVASYGGENKGFIYSDGVMHDLTNLVLSGMGTANIIAATGINNNGQIAVTACTSLCQAYRLDPVAHSPAPPPPVNVVEYFHEEYNHYFMTASPIEIAALDAGTFPGWQRTGQVLKAYATPVIGTNPVCRLYNDSFAPKSTHFYSADPNECIYAENFPGWAWQFEGITMYIATPDAAGTCPSGTAPIYRLYNNGMGGAPNHRYTSSTAIKAQMIGQGWVPEGYGADAVIMCMPS